ncbi:MAG: hypothetical protein NVV82_13505 [Sporocytophaga sp.]|nr:hypothetical protein [Sporocytophaga sp.]
MKSLPVHPKKTGYKKPVKENTERNVTGKNNKYGTLKRHYNCNISKLYYGKAGFKINNKFSGRKDKFSLWEK